MRAIAALAIIGTIVLWWSYNRLSVREEATSTAWALVQAQMQRKADLIPSLEIIVGAAAEHDRMQATLAATRDAWARRTRDTSLPAARNLSAAVRGAMVMVESSPTPRADRAFASLRYELAGTENRIAVARQRYNDSVRDYNSSLRSPVHSLTTSMFTFRPKAYF